MTERKYARSRPSNRRAPNRRILVVAGGARTEPQYLRHVKRAVDAHGVAIVIETDGRSPSSVLETAMRKRDEDRREARLARDSANTFDEVWIVIDHDEFTDELRRVFPEARTATINVALSSPCFEVWLVWHAAGLAHWVTAGQAQAAAKDAGVCAGAKGKEVVVSRISGAFLQAEARSRRVRTDHAASGRAFPDNNPSSDVDLLVRAILGSSTGVPTNL